MTIEEKREAIQEYCARQSDSGDCDMCPLFDVTEPCHEEDAFVERNYAILFGNSKPVIKDSGERREFETGAVRDMASGKGRMDLLPWAAIIEVAKHCENGAIKYGEHNVDKGLPTSSFCDSAARHLAKYLDGWTDEPHLLAAAWNLLWAVQMTVKKPEMVDTPWRGDNDV